MSTNLPKRQTRSVEADPKQERKGATKPADRRAEICAGKVKIRIQLLDTPTAARIWRALPIFSTVKTWGEAIHFETHVESGREHTARAIAEPGDICFWVEDDCIIIVFGRTPISRPDEYRLPRPCNLWARALDDVRVLNVVRPGERVSVAQVKD